MFGVIGSLLGVGASIFNNVAKASGWFNGGMNLINNFKSTMNGGTNLNSYANEVERNRAAAFGTVAKNNNQFVQDQYDMARDPMSSQYGQSLKNAAVASSNQNLQSSMLSGQINAYDAMALQNRAVGSITNNLSQSLSPLQQNATRNVQNLDQYYAGASSAKATNIYGQGSNFAIGGGSQLGGGN